MIVVENCPYCGGELKFFKAVDSAPLKIVKYFSDVICMETVSNYYACKICGLRIQTPRMNDESIKEFYSSGEYRKTLGMSQDRVEIDEGMRADSCMRFLVENKVDIKSHLDIGSSNGKFIQETYRHYGIDSEGYDLLGGTPLPDKKYELVSSIHTLEHCPDPMKELHYYRTLSDKYLLLEVPKLAEPPGYKGLRFSHLFNFPKEVIEKMVENAGYKILVSEQKPDTRILAEVY